MHFFSWLLPSVLLAIVCCGCGVDELATPSAARLKGLATCYVDYAVAKGGVGPADEKTLKKHMRSMQGFQLEMSGLDPENIEAAFVSDRDQEPFVIFYGQTVSFGLPNPRLLAHEKTGKNGKRLAALVDGNVELIDEGRFKELTAE
jgi:hypothetical protein